MGYYSTIQKKKILQVMATWMDLEGIILSEINQKERDSRCMISFICGIEINHTPRKRDQICGYQRQWWVEQLITNFVLGAICISKLMNIRMYNYKQKQMAWY